MFRVGRRCQSWHTVVLPLTTLLSLILLLSLHHVLLRAALRVIIVAIGPVIEINTLRVTSLSWEDCEALDIFRDLVVRNSIVYASLVISRVCIADYSLVRYLFRHINASHELLRVD